MSDKSPPTDKKGPIDKRARWVRLFVDYIGLLAFLVTLMVTGSAMSIQTAKWFLLTNGPNGTAPALCGVQKP